MKKHDHIPSGAIVYAVLCAMLIGIGSSSACAQNPDHATAIKRLIGRTYDQPDHKVETSPVVVVDDYALADWTQGPKGERALLRKARDSWEIMACGGDGFKDAKVLKEAGIPAATAEKLVTRLGQAEKSLSPSRVRQFSLFGTADDPRMSEQPSYPLHPRH